MAQRSKQAHDPRFDDKPFICHTKRCRDCGKTINLSDAFGTPRCMRCGQFLVLQSS